MNPKSRRQSYLWGHIAEYLCIILLLGKGYSILARRYRNTSGEIDIIAARGSLIVFIEVKARADRAAALLSVTPVKQQRVLRAASGYIASNAKYAHHGLRFDMMVVTSLLRIYHLKDAWRA